jgi:hypothetical protein
MLNTDKIAGRIGISWEQEYSVKWTNTNSTVSFTDIQFAKTDIDTVRYYVDHT